MSSIFNNVRVLGNLNVKGTTTSVSSENVLIADSKLLLNSGYTTATPESGGIVVNFNPVATGVLISGVITATEINVAGQTLVAGDYIQVSSARTVANNGLYEVISYADPLLTINGAPDNDFSQSALSPDAGDKTAVITHTNLSAFQCSETGIWQVGVGNNGTMAYSNLLDSTTGALIISGKSGGQVAYGGTESGDDLTLRSTSDATKGNVIIDEVTASSSTTTGALLVGGGVGVAGDVYVGGQVAADTIIGNSATVLTVGSATSTGVNIATSSTKTKVLGELEVLSSIDRSAAGALTIGGTTATSVAVGTASGSGVTLGNSTGSIKMTGVVQRAVVDDASTTAQTPAISALNPVTRFTGTDSFTYTLPDVGADEDGMVLTFYKSGATGTVTLAANAADTGLIDGGTMDLSSQYDRTTVMFVNSDLRWITI
jgi:hypothetical protein